MQHAKKKQAVGKFAHLHAEGQTKDQVIIAILKDEKGYTEEEAEEIYAAILDATADLTPSQEEPAEADPDAYVTCEEWTVEFVNGKAEKLKLRRSNVKLLPWVMENLNEACNPLNPTMYYPA